MSPSRAQLSSRHGAEALHRVAARARLAEARIRTLELVAPLDPERLERQHSPLLSPLAWDLGHIAAFEDLWLSQRAGGLAALRPDLAAVYDAAEAPRARRAELPLLRAAEARRFLSDVRQRSVALLERVDLSAEGGPLNAGGFVWELVAQHERQHNETMMQSLLLAPAGFFVPERPAAGPRPTAGPGGMVRYEPTELPLGSEIRGFAYDNERPRHLHRVGAFELDRRPVTNAEFASWIDAGGYHRREWWSDAGWRWKEAEGIEQPLFWTGDGRVRSFERVEALASDEPVSHVSWYEADAYARARGARLPTEAEWERAATWDAAGERKREFPWGDEPASAARANLDGRRFGPLPAGGPAAGASPEGVLGLIGDVWEWTSSRFGPYPGFWPFPYPEYSQSGFGGGHRVLRGGSWATHAPVARSSFRNWDLPERRQIVAGFRCARDAG